ncbi:hypothetical protein L6164_025499 [Bauhinia variegata]|uniref:Uncharacterized protein n=1 Tax=Bauhinia variegata TaxID=167791 RepID=A0ACB9M402_BAUVA|nr:hypothetical protein L6164_025499 [Bauhinia variegata]
MQYNLKVDLFIHSVNLFAKMKQSDSIRDSLPEDVAIKIASLLQVRDLCSLSCCSRFWRELCGSDCIWESLARERWPLLAGFDFPASSSSTSANAPNFKEWRKLYIERKNELAASAAAVAKFVEDCRPCKVKSFEVRDYLKAMEDLRAMKFGFKDVQMLLFQPKMNVLLNLLGLHYCRAYLEIPGDYLMEALQACEISDRHVCIKWWKVGRWFYGFRMRDETHCRWVSLVDLATDDEEHILGVLHRGAVHEVLRVVLSDVDLREFQELAYR